MVVRQSGASEIDSESSFNRLYDEASTSSLSSRAEQALFNVLFVMTEQHRTSRLGSIVMLLLLLVDVVQVTLLIATTELGWPARMIGPLQENLSVMRLVLPAKSPTLFSAIYGIATVLVWVSLVDAFVVGQSFQRNQHKRIWPIKLLKVAVTSFVTAGFIPLLGILLIPMSCSRLQEYNPATVESCMGSLRVVLFGMSSVTLAAFIPICVLTASVYYDSNPDSRHPMAKPSGRIDLFDVSVRTLTVFVTTALQRSAPELTAGLLMVVYAGIATYAGVALPYYRPPVMRLVRAAARIGRVGAYSTYAALSAWSVVLSLVSRGSDGTGASIPLALAALLSSVATGCVLAFVGPAANIRRLKFTLVRVFRGEEAKAPAGTLRCWPRRSRTAPADGEAAAVLESEARVVPSDAPQLEYRGDVLGEALHDIVSLTEQEEEAAGTSATDATLADLFPQRRPCVFLLDTDVELAARMVISDIRQLRGARPKRHVVLGVLRRIYTLGMQQFPESVTLQIAYARMLKQYADAEGIAVRLLVKAFEKSSMPDDRFTIFSLHKTWEQQRESQILGSSDVNIIGMIELKRFSRVAAVHHKAALRKLHQFWSHAYRGRRRLPIDDLLRRLADIVRSRDQADLAYKRLLGKFPKAKNLIRQYAAFLGDVKNDRAACAYFFRRADEIEEMESRQHAAQFLGAAHGRPKEGHAEPGAHATEGAKAAKAEEESSMGGSSLGFMDVAAKSLVNREELSVIVTLQTRVKHGLTLIAALAALTFALNYSMFATLDSDMDFIDWACERREYAQEMLVAARGLQLRAREKALYPHERQPDEAWNGTRARLVHATASFDKYHHEYSESWPPLRALDQGEHHPLNLSFYRPGASGQVQASARGLWDAGNLYVVSANHVLDMDEASLSRARTSPSWRFLIDNGNDALLEAFTAATVHTVDHAHGEIDAWLVQQLFVVSGIVLVIVALGSCVFWPSMLRVQAKKTNLADVIREIPSATLRAISKHYSAAMASLSGEEDRVSDDEREAQGPRAQSSMALDGDEEEEADGVKDEDDGAQLPDPPEPTATPMHHAREQHTPALPAGGAEETLGREASGQEAEGLSRSAMLSAKLQPLSPMRSLPPLTAGIPKDRVAVVEIAKSPSLGPPAVLVPVRGGTVTPGPPGQAPTPPSGVPPDGRRLASGPDSSRHEEGASDDAASGGDGDERADVAEEQSAPGEEAGAERAGNRSARSPSRFRSVVQHASSRVHRSQSQRETQGLRNLVVRMALLLFTIAALQVGSFGISYIYVSAGGINAKELAAGGGRKYLGFQLALLSRELFINDEAMGARQDIVRRLEAQLGRMRALHDAVRFGNASDGTHGSDNRNPRLDELMYTPSCMLLDQARCEQVLVRPQVAVRQGMHKALLFMWEQVEEILHAARQGQFGATTYHITQLRSNHTQLAFVLDAMDWDVADALHAAREMFLDEARAARTAASTAVLLALLFNISILVLTYAFGFRAMINKLTQDGVLVQSMLVAIPQELRAQAPGLSRYYALAPAEE